MDASERRTDLERAEIAAVSEAIEHANAQTTPDDALREAVGFQMLEDEPPAPRPKDAQRSFTDKLGVRKSELPQAEAEHARREAAKAAQRAEQQELENARREAQEAHEEAAQARREVERLKGGNQ